MKYRIGIILLSLLVAIIPIGCEQDECDDCGPGVEEGYLFKRVTQDDLSALAGIEGIALDVCISYQVLDVATGEIDRETVTVVKDCCCDIYE